jgi:hypothetical protein
MSTSSINRNHERSCVSDERSNRSFGIAGCRKLWEQRTVQEPPTECLVEMLTLVLKKQQFYFWRKRLLACSKHSSSSLSLCIHFMSTSSINRNHERGNFPLHEHSPWWRNCRMQKNMGTTNRSRTSDRMFSKRPGLGSSAVRYSMVLSSMWLRACIASKARVICRSLKTFHHTSKILPTTWRKWKISSF